MLESDEALPGSELALLSESQEAYSASAISRPSGACSLCTHCRPGGGGGGDVVSLVTRLGQAWVLVAVGSQCCL